MTSADEPAAGPRLAALRSRLASSGLDGFVVPLADEHQGEYVPEGSRRLQWLTGFSGSAGLAVVLRERAAIFIDGRYTLQAESQVDGACFERHNSADHSPQAWIGANLAAGESLGYDPWLHTRDGVGRLRAACEKAGGRLEACAQNPVDAVWHDRPPPPKAPIVPHPLRFAGLASAEKRSRVGADLEGACVLSAPDSIAWLLNVRGGDVPYTPLPLSFAIFFADGRVDWFVDEDKTTPALAGHLGADVRLRPPAEFPAALEALAGRPIRADPVATPAWVFDCIAGAGGVAAPGPDPCALPKACKNPVELAGSRAAHVRDGVALSRFLHWLPSAAGGGGVDEIGAAEKLAELRRDNDLYQGPSFPTISGAGANGAIVHYRVSEATNRRLAPGTLYLVDSGGQYLDGTTDVTRTVAIGPPGDEQRRCFSAVLKGHIALAASRFPEGTTGSQLDALARQALWRLGLDYDHGTGHGVGSYLGVHEGPQRISKAANGIGLRPGMIVSNEPGYYKTGAFGIRIENLVCVAAVEAPAGAERTLLGFETLTLAPIDRDLIAPEDLSADEIAWLDDYHRQVRETLTPHLDTPTAAWLAEVTRPID